MLKGLGICPGLAMARVLVLKEQTHVISDALLPEQEIEKELARFSHALEQALAKTMRCMKRRERRCPRM